MTNKSPALSLTSDSPDQESQAQLPKRNCKCLGYKSLHDEHSLGEPGRYCTGPPDELPDPSPEPKGKTYAIAQNVDEEAVLAEKLEEERLAKDARIRNLKYAIATQKQKLVDMQTSSVGFPLPKAATPGSTSSPSENSISATATTLFRQTHRPFLLALLYIKVFPLLSEHRWIRFLRHRL